MSFKGCASWNEKTDNILEKAWQICTLVLLVLETAEYNAYKYIRFSNQKPCNISGFLPKTVQKISDFRFLYSKSF